MRRVLVSVLSFALVFGILATWLGPKVIAYWYAPPVPAGAATAFHCTDAVTWAMRKLVWTQIVGSAAGAAVGLVLGALLGRRTPGAAPRSP
jgi:NhaP-type Na+/H+ or K+/H+ antiporter